VILGKDRQIRVESATVVQAPWEFTASTAVISEQMSVRDFITILLQKLMVNLFHIRPPLDYLSIVRPPPFVV
jgi:hypothetical protein